MFKNYYYNPNWEFNAEEILKDVDIESMKEAALKLGEKMAELGATSFEEMQEILQQENNKEKKMTFEDAYDMCDFEIQCRYNYLDELLCEIDNEIMYLTDELEKAKVDEEIAREMFEVYGEVNGETLSNGFKVEQIQNEIDYLYKKYDVVLDMYDEVFLGILANIE